MRNTALLNRARKITAVQQMPLEDYVVCLILLEKEQDFLEESLAESGNKQIESMLKDTQDAELALRERFCDICEKYQAFKTAERAADIRDGIREFTDGNREKAEYFMQMFHIPLPEQYIEEQETVFER